MVSSVSVGMVVAGRYTLERCINRGGIGSLWLVRDEQSNNYCGLRLAESSGQGIVELAARYLAEVDVVGRIRCENVVDVLDYGEWNGLPFLVVEHVEGEELSAALVHRGSMQPKAAYRIIAQTARALARAHAAGIVHGDLTPEHILITSDGMQPMAKVFNFGLSQRSAEAGLTNATRIGSFLHLPYYSSPEQVSNKPADWRADLWSLAVICYECLIGRRPFDTSNFAELLMLITSDPIAPIILPGGRTPSALQSWWERATARDPNERFQSAKEMADALGKSFGFPLVFVPEPTSASLGPQASPASLPIVLRDSAAPSPTSSSPPERLLTPNPKLKSYPSISTARPMQVAVRSSSPVPGSNGSIQRAFRHSTEIGLGSAPPPNVLPKSGLSRFSDPIDPTRATSSVRLEDAEAPPSSLKVDVDIVPPSADAAQRLNAAETTASASQDEELVNGFPISEAPTVARKQPPEPSRRVVLRGGASSDEPLIMSSAPPMGRHRAAWLTAAVIVIMGTIGAVRLVRIDKRSHGAALTTAARPEMLVATAARPEMLATTAARSEPTLAPLADAGQVSAAADNDDSEGIPTPNELEAKLADELARVTAAVDGTGAQKGAADRARRASQKTQVQAAAPRAPHVPAKPADKPATESPPPTPVPSTDSTPKKSPDNKAKPGTSVEREYGI